MSLSMYLTHVSKGKRSVTNAYLCRENMSSAASESVTKLEYYK